MWSRFAFALAVCAGLSACGATSVYAPDDAVRAATFVSGEPPSLTLYTVISNRSNAGAHTGLLINGSQQVMFDPAGSWTHPRLPERNDVFFGVNDKMVNYFIDYHARETFRVMEQKVFVSPEVATHCRQLVRIPMAGKLNSLNLAVATALMLYEIRRPSLKA